MDFSTFETIGTIEYVEDGQDADQQFPQFAYGATQPYVLQVGGEAYTLIVHLNFVTNNLFFSVTNSSGEYLAQYRKLAEVPREAGLSNPPNLLNGVITGGELYFHNWGFYFREV